MRFLGDRYGINRGLGLPGIGAPKEAMAVPGPLMQALLELARSETNAEVRSQIASTARRLVTIQALELVAVLAAHHDDVTDPYIPLLNWWILEAHLNVNREAVLAAFKASPLWDLPMAQQHLLPRLMRRFAVEGRRQDLMVCAQLLGMAPTPQHAAYLMKGFEEAYRGRPMVGLPDELLQAMAAAGQSPLILRVRQGDPAAVKEALTTVRDSKAKIAERIFYARVFGEVRIESALPALLAVAAGNDPATLRKAALVAIMTYDHPDIGSWAVALLPKTTGDVRVATLALASSRAPWSLNLLHAIQNGQIPASSVPPNLVDRIRGHKDRNVADLAAKIFPPPAASGGVSANQRIAEVEAILKQGTGDPYKGETLYMERCASCHKLFFKGGKVGPELTNYQRDNLGTMLLSIINPNAEIREGFQYYIVETTDGRSLSGFMVERDSQIVVLRGIEGENLTLRQSEIKELQPMGRSLMPEGLLDGLDAKQLRDFFAYLRISQPITR